LGSILLHYLELCHLHPYTLFSFSFWHFSSCSWLF
jgi:hypothetical protein